jgi:hypothetical protein
MQYCTLSVYYRHTVRHSVLLLLSDGCGGGGGGGGGVDSSVINSVFSSFEHTVPAHCLSEKE